ncbi:MAG TPA: hypothetical protein DDW95_01720 [Alphaproteobacteria bacterium]|nr:hypothetical protein [Alphaproteobacteria bacterium]
MYKRDKIFATLLATIICLLFSFPAQAEMTAQEKTALKAKILEVLNENPELLITALHGLQQRVEQEQEQAKLTTLQNQRKALEQDPDSFVAGNPAGDITLVEFFDYRCGYCKKARPVVKRLIAEDGNIRLVMKEFPILGPNSETASKAAIAAMAQGKYQQFHDALMAAKGGLGRAQILQIAADTGLDRDKLAEDMQKAYIADIIRKNRQLAARLEISGTPAFVIGDAIVPGVASLEQMQQLVAQARADCQSC